MLGSSKNAKETLWVDNGNSRLTKYEILNQPRFINIVLWQVRKCTVVELLTVIISLML